MLRWIGRRPDLWLPAVLAPMVAVLAYWIVSTPTGRLFFSWPDGGVWSNMIAWLLGLAVGALTTYYLRDHVGRRLSAWMHRHSPDREAVQEAHEAMHAAHQIVADVYRAVNGGEDHPLAPGGQA